MSKIQNEEMGNMNKSLKNKEKDAIARSGKVWVKIPDMDYRQASGVEFRGKYMTLAEYRRLKARKKYGC